MTMKNGRFRLNRAENNPSSQESRQIRQSYNKGPMPGTKSVLNHARRFFEAVPETAWN